jgi:hypothetical protein
VPVEQARDDLAFSAFDGPPADREVRERRRRAQV